MKRVSIQSTLGHISAAAVWSGVRAMLLSTAVLLLSVPMGRAQAAAAASQSEQSAANEVLAELRKLRIEIFEYRIERRTEDLDRLERALQSVRNERLRLEEEDRARAQQIAEAETYLATHGQTLTPEQRTHFEAMKAGIGGTHSDKTQAEYATIMKREAEADDRLRLAHQQLQQLKAIRNELVSRQPSGK